MKKILVALLVAMLALIATVALAEDCPGVSTPGNSKPHNFTIHLDTTKAPTCLSLGTALKKCANCDATTTVDVPQVACSYEKVDYVSATCQNEGYDLMVCKWCNDSYKVEWPKIAHNHKWVEVKATCLTDGYNANPCTVCGYETYHETLYATGHNKGAWVKTEGEDTCTTDATVYHKCTKCGETYPITVNDVKKHNWGEWKLTTKGNCIKDGEETRVCKNDPTHVEKRAVPAKGHQILEDSIRTNDKGVVVGYCTVCGQMVPVDEKPVVKPEETQKPEEKPTEKPEDKPTTKPTTKPSTPNKPTTNNSGVTIPATGETMNVAPFIMMLVAIVGLAVTKQKVTE